MEFWSWFPEPAEGPASLPSVHPRGNPPLDAAALAEGIARLERVL